MRKNRFIILLVIFCLIVSGCSREKNSKKDIIVTIFPYFNITKLIANDKCNIIMLIPHSIEPHEWIANSQDVIRLKNSDLIIINGGGLEHINDILNEVKDKNKIIDISTKVNLLSCEFNPTIPDPHLWLDPVNMSIATKEITNKLSEIDPRNKQYYEQNSLIIVSQLDKLNKKYEKSFSNVKRRDFITAHASFQYLAKRYKLTQHAIMGLSPEEEPNPSKITKIIRFAKKNLIKVIFYESLSDPKLSNLIAKEVGASIMPLNPIEGQTEKENNLGKSYLKFMEENLSNLLIALNK